MEKNPEFYSYPIYDFLSYSVLDEVLHFNFIHRFYEIMGYDARINFVVQSLGRDMDKLRELAPYGRFILGGRYFEATNRLIEYLYKKGRLKVYDSRGYYCEKCDEHYKVHQIKRIEREIKIDLIKIRIGKRLYFVGEIPSGEEPIGVYISTMEKMLKVKFPGETWIVPEELRDVLEKNLEVPSNKIEEVFMDKDFDLEPYVVVGEKSSRLIRRGTPEETLVTQALPSYSVIYSLKKRVPINVCPKCGNVLVEESIPVLFAENSKVRVQISSPDGSHKLPILFCSNCGHIEYGERIKNCPLCGNIMQRKFYLRPELTALGAYLHSLKTQGGLSFLHHKRLGLKNAFSDIFQLYGKSPFERVVLLAHNLSEENSEDEKCALLTKRRGSLEESDLRKVRKLKNVVKNTVRYVEIYGYTEEHDDVDDWLLWKSWRLKMEMQELVKLGKIEEGFDKLYNYVIGDFSHFYIPLKRREPLYFNLIKDVLLLLYPYLPEFSSKLMDDLEIEDRVIDFEEYPEIEGVEVLRDILRILRKYRERNNIPLREPLKKVVFVSEYAPDVNELLPYFFKVENVLVLNAVLDWDEMEIEIEPNIDEISSAYRAWAPKIAFLLRRKNVREIMDAMEKGGYTLGVEGFIIKITPKMVRYIKKVPEGYEHLESKYGDIYIYNERDTSTRRIRLVREIIRRINSMRKDIDMDFDDLVDVSISGDPEAIKMVKGYEEDIREKCLARNVDFEPVEYGYVVEWPIMGYRITIAINPLFKRWVIKAFKSIPGVDESRAELLFKLGFGSVYELMETKPEELAEMTGIPLNMAKEIVDYLYSAAFKSRKIKGKEYCPFCGAELDPEDEFCPLCGAPIRVKMEEGKMKKGNLYLVVGDFRKMIESIPEDMLKSKKLLITKDDPEEIKKEFNLKNVATLWISYVPFGKSIKPKEIGKLEAEIERFIENGEKLIMVDCFDLLMAINSLDTLMGMLQRIKAKLREKEAYLFFNMEEVESFELEEIMKYVDGEIK